jgi:adenylate kinase
MKTSDVFKDGELTPEQEEEAGEDAEALLKTLKFPWHCEKGIVGNVPLLNKEFNEYRQLNPVKIFITGPPASGKSFYSQKLAKYYNIPHVDTRQITEKALTISLKEADDIGENEFEMEIKTKCDELREAMAEKMAEARGEPPEGEEWPEIDRATLPIRVPDDILYRLLKEALARNDCRNRGYVLDGFPRTHKDAKYIFLKRKIIYNEEGEIEEVDEPELEEG